MLRYASYDIVFQEIPGEVTLALNLTGCPNRCPGCHSTHLQQEAGEVLDEKALAGLLLSYGNAVTCVCFMGGDANPADVERLALTIRRASKGKLKTGWYSGRSDFPSVCSWTSFDYVKLGPYVAERGGLTAETTNQRFYRIDDGTVSDITSIFRRGGNHETAEPIFTDE